MKQRQPLSIEDRVRWYLDRFGPDWMNQVTGKKQGKWDLIGNPDQNAQLSLKDAQALDSHAFITLGYRPFESDYHSRDMVAATSDEPCVHAERASINDNTVALNAAIGRATDPNGPGGARITAAERQEIWEPLRELLGCYHAMVKLVSGPWLPGRQFTLFGGRR